MIHLAPCDCELHVRIRELEAELRWAREGVSASNPSETWWPKNTTQKIQRQMVMEWKARAEKAEASLSEVLGIRRVLEARVAELEAELAAANDSYRQQSVELADVQELNRSEMERFKKTEARAEKAEKWAVAADHEVEIQKARAEKAEASLSEVLGIRRVLEARVAELEAKAREENGLGVKPLSQRGSREAE